MRNVITFPVCWAIAVLILVFAFHAPAGADQPATPVITEPAQDGQILNAADVHMETAPFSDTDPGDMHFCTDWQIQVVDPEETVWQASCVMGLEAVHAHFGDGSFMGSHAGGTELLPDTEYVLRVRHRDDSGAADEWSDWAERPFVTGPATQTFPLELDDILDDPEPEWHDTGGAEIVLPPSANPPRLILEGSTGDLLLEIAADDGNMNALTNPAIISDHVPLRVRLQAGDVTNLVLPESDLTFTDHEGDEHTVYLPAANLAGGEEDIFWVAAFGATFAAQPGQTEPDFSELARGAPVPWITHQPGFKVEIVATGFRLPVNIAFVPSPGPNPGDPLYYVSELYGIIKVVTNDGTVSDYATDLLNFVPTGNFPGSGEQGLAGIVVDDATGDVFASLLYDSGGPHYPKVVRFTSTDGGITAATETIILDMPGESQGQSHQVSNLSIGPDDKLYLHMGDGFNAGTAQDLESFRGKVLRFEKDGSASTDNPFYDAGNGITARDYVFAYGVRNPFGGAWRDADGSLYTVENGPSVDRFARIDVGVNYGWNGTDASMFNLALYNWQPAVGPVNIAFVESALYGGSLFPASNLGHAFVSESGPTWGTGQQSNGKRIREFELDLNGDLVAGPTPFVSYVGSGKATVVALAAGPDGLYFSDFYKDQDYSSPIDLGANILRVKFVGAADFTADVTEGQAPLTVQFTDTSTVPSPTSWEWNFGDGGMSTDQHPTHTYTADGIYDVSLAVIGANGLAVEEKHGFVRVGDFPSIGFIVGSLPESPSDDAVADFIESHGYVVDLYDDEPANRPPASQLAQDHDLIVISSTVLSSNIGAEFRNEAVPLIFWEQALTRIDREPLSDDGTVVPFVTSINVVDSSHPITETVGLGTHPVFESPANMSVARAPFASGTEVLASRVGAPGDAAIAVAEDGASLLGGHTAPARRVFFFLEDASFLEATNDGRELLERAVLWALGGSDHFSRGDCNADAGFDISDPIYLLGYLFGSNPVPGCEDGCDANDDGNLALDDAIAALTTLFSGGGPLPPPNSCGADPTPDGLGCAMTPCP